MASLDKSRHEKALRQAEAPNLDFKTQLDKLTLVELDDGFTKTDVVRGFRLLCSTREHEGMERTD